jgi:hypothetical protein
MTLDSSIRGKELCHWIGLLVIAFKKHNSVSPLYEEREICTNEEMMYRIRADNIPSEMMMKD